MNIHKSPSEEVVMPDFQDLDGHIVKAKWIEVPLLEQCVLMIGEELEELRAMI